MDRGIVIFVGCVLTFSSAWLGLVLAPDLQLKKSDPNRDETAVVTEAYPRTRTEIEERGKVIYENTGCIYCHSQQVRSTRFGNNSDIARGWGTRRSVPRDYLNDRPVLLGTMRTGPDLANVGMRWSADWQYKHLYNPRMMLPGSIMPSFKYMFKVQPMPNGQKSADAVTLTGVWETEIAKDHEVVPTEDAKALIAYLMSLKQNADLPEARE